MRKAVIIIISSIFLLASCDKLEKAITEAKSKHEKEKTGKKQKDGLVKQYHKNGTIKSEINYNNGVKNGLAKSYYENGKLRQEINYVNNKKDGAAKTYYENGKLYQTTHYSQDQIHGIREKYRQNGQLVAQIPYQEGKVCMGLKEYLVDGDLKKQYPEIVIEEDDRILEANQFRLKIKLSDGSRNVKFYMGKLTEDGCLDSDILPISSPRPGEMEMTFDLPPGTFIMQELNFMAEVKTKLGNPFITHKKYNLAIESKGY